MKFYLCYKPDGGTLRPEQWVGDFYYDKNREYPSYAIPIRQFLGRCSGGYIPTEYLIDLKIKRKF